MGTKVVDYDLAEAPRDLTGLEGYSGAFILLRWRGRPVGRVWLPADNVQIEATHVMWASSVQCGAIIAKRQAEDVLSWHTHRAASPMRRLTSSVAVCTKDRPKDLHRCLSAVCNLTTAPDEIVVIDNNSRDEQTFEVCRNFPVRYVREDRKGVGWARARAAVEARNEIIVFTDDDAAPDKGWLDAMLEPFAEPGVAGVTGLVMPMELETRSQEQFEMLCGFSRGFERQDHDSSTISPLAAARVGAGASMALRRDLVNKWGLFQVNLGPGTVAQAAEETYAFYRLLSLGYRLVYNPDALVWHRHRSTPAELEKVLYAYTLSTYVYLLRCFFLHGEGSAISVGLGWFRHHHLRNLVRCFLGKNRHQKEQEISITIAEISAVFASPLAFVRSLRDERKILRQQPGTERLSNGSGNA